MNTTSSVAKKYHVDGKQILRGHVGTQKYRYFLVSARRLVKSTVLAGKKYGAFYFLLCIPLIKQIFLFSAVRQPCVRLEISDSYRCKR